MHSGAGRRATRRRDRASLRELIQRVGDELVSTEGGGDEAGGDETLMSRRERVVRKLWADALDGDIPAIRLLVEYTDGKPPGPALGTAAAESGPPALTADELAQASAELAEWEAGLTSEHGPTDEPRGAAGAG